jgi:hypothetical protein
MNERKAVTWETSGEYHKAGKKEKGLIRDQYVRLTGYNRKYAIRILSKPPDKTTTVVRDGNPLVFKAEKKPDRKIGWVSQSTPGKPSSVSKSSGAFMGIRAAPI